MCWGCAVFNVVVRGGLIGAGGEGVDQVDVWGRVRPGRGKCKGPEVMCPGTLGRPVWWRAVGDLGQEINEPAGYCTDLRTLAFIYNSSAGTGSCIPSSKKPSWSLSWLWSHHSLGFPLPESVTCLPITMFLHLCGSVSSMWPSALARWDGKEGRYLPHLPHNLRTPNNATSILALETESGSSTTSYF